MKLAILGTGAIITDALDAISEVNGIEKVAILARERSVDKGRAFAEKYGIGRVCMDYDELLAADDIDTVYVGLINSVHFEYAKKALLAGKDVILEKPFTTSVEETKELVSIAKDNDRYLFEAITNRHSKIYDRMKKELSDIGDIRLVMANYSQYSSRYERYKKGEVAPAFDPDAFGGAINDLGIYNLSLVVSLLGKPKSARYDANTGFNGVDTSGVATLIYENFIATISVAKDCDGPCHFTIEGEKGWLRIPGKPNVAERLELFKDGRLEEFAPTPDKNRMVQEFRDFEEIRRTGDRERMLRELDMTQNVMEVLIGVRANI